MKIVDTAFDAKTRAALNALLERVSGNLLPKDASTLDVLALQAKIAMRLIAAARGGERDHCRLKAIAEEDLVIKRHY